MAALNSQADGRYLMATADVRNGMPDRQNAADKLSPEMVGIDDGGERVLMPRDPFADARAWLAAMEFHAASKSAGSATAGSS